MPSFADIVAVVRRRQADQGPLLRQMAEVARRYNGEYVIPLPDLDDTPDLPPLTPLLIAEAIDHMGQRAGSVIPNIGCPALDPAKEQGVRSREYARVRREILVGTWARSRMKLKMRRWYRHLAGYVTCSGLVLPDFTTGMPKVVSRDPLTTYPEPTAPGDDEIPANVAWTFAHPASRLREMKPALAAENGGPIGPPQDGHELWETVEWVDGDVIVVGLLGPVDPNSRSANPAHRHRAAFSDLAAVGDTWAELGRWPNRAGMMPAICPARVSLDKIASQVANAVGQVDLMARLMALDIIATEKSIWPDRYVIGRQGGQPTIVGGEWADGRTGRTNLLQDVEAVGELRSTPDPNNKITMDRLERNFRISTGLVPQTGGETFGALRTGRGIDSLMAAAVDPRIQELHETMESYLPHLNEAIFATYQGWWNRKRFVLFSGDAGAFSTTEFTPATHIETRENAVSYTVPGADVSQTTVVLGQMRQVGAISLHSFRAKHPWVTDPEAEAARTTEEAVEEALMASIAQRLASGELPLVMAALIEKHVKAGKDIIAAIEAADEQMRRRQSEAAPPPDEAAGQVIAPEQALGLEAGPAGVAAPPAPETPGAPPPGPDGLAALLGALTSAPSEGQPV